MAGKSARREDVRFITGAGRYVSDLRSAGALHMAVFRSPLAHARIARLDIAAAAAVPGVKAVITGEDIREAGLGTLPTAWNPPGRNGARMLAPPWPVLAESRARYCGEAIAAVAAESPAAARAALALIEVDFEELPAVCEGRRALAASAPAIHPESSSGNLCLDFDLGDAARTAEAMRAAAHVVEIELSNNRVAVCPMEPRAVLAEPGAAGGLTLYTATQVPHSVRGLLARVLHMEEAAIRVVSPDVGGGFGGKMALYPEDVLASLLALQAKRPVRWTASRSEAFLADTQARDHWTTARLGLDGEGRIVALRVSTLANVGAYLSLAAPAIPTWYYAPLLTGAYRVPAAHAEVKLAFTNTTPVDAYRGAGRPEASFVIERLMDEAAHRLGLAPDEIRRRNFLTPADYPADTALGLSIDCGDHPALLERALAASRWKDFPERRHAALARGRHRGIGLSAYLEIAGGSPSHMVAAQGAAGGSYEAARVHVIPSGGVIVSVGTHSHGQSHETVFPRLVAERLGLDPAQVQFVQGDTDRVPVGRGTFASRSLALAGAAIVTSVGRIGEKMREVAGELLEVQAEDIVFEKGRLAVRGTDRALPFAEVARACYRLPQALAGRVSPGLDETAFVEPPGWTFPGGCHVVEVEVDPETGAVELIAVTAVDDVGNVIDPVVVEGQIHGGLAQGLGQAMLEQVAHDPDSGQPLTGSFMDYAMPRAANLVSFGTLTHGVPTSRNPLGVKGCAESGTVGVPAAFVNAVMDALRPLGVTDIAMPATPFRVWSAIEKARKAAAAPSAQPSTM
ncbi:xanthine dehydrogenase family protein molybdopterin-binding subunit [Aestuariivirga sp.]|uniref:xanthine dehydrogenase family protein molybdopterin-binding subunit n=1 Tax=Aestuariivirga sp. TaxID=2650926 RepID=UPI003919F3B5